MRFCDRCGQELDRSLCGFCGNKIVIVESPVKVTEERKQWFRWFRSDRPKRYLAEMALVGLVVLISAFLVVPSFQTSPNETPLAESSTESEETTSNQESSTETDWNYNEISRSFDEDGNPQQGQYSFTQWLETWDYSYAEPTILRDSNCRFSACVRETLRISFAPLADYNLYSIKGAIRNTSGQRITPAQANFEIVEGDDEFVFEFLNDSYTDLRNYPGNIFFQLEFFQFDVPHYRIRPEDRILDLSGALVE